MDAETAAKVKDYIQRNPNTTITQMQNAVGVPCDAPYLLVWIREQIASHGLIESKDANGRFRFAYSGQLRRSGHVSSQLDIMAASSEK
jgi:hypothetical protein